MTENQAQTIPEASLLQLAYTEDAESVKSYSGVDPAS